jgi:long-chain fatty acid transport protein
MYKIDPKWNVYGDVTWTRHSRFNQAHLKYANSKVVVDPTTGGLTRSDETILNPNWRNTYKVAVGTSYQYSEPLQLRFGVAYDQSPVKSADYRMTTLPDSNRIWLSFGAKYDINKQHSINAAYSHLFIQNASANVNGWCGGSSVGRGFASLRIEPHQRQRQLQEQRQYSRPAIHLQVLTPPEVSDGLLENKEAV